MLTLEVKSDGGPYDVSTITAMAWNTGMRVVATLPDGTTIVAEPDIPEHQVVEVLVPPDDPHPVFEPATPVAFEPVIVPAEPSPAVEPAEPMEPVVVTESSP